MSGFLQAARAMLRPTTDPPMLFSRRRQLALQMRQDPTEVESTVAKGLQLQITMLRRHKQASAIVRGAIRSHQARRQFYRLVQASIIVQSEVRLHQARRRNRASGQIQKHIRRQLERVAHIERLALYRRQSTARMLWAKIQAARKREQRRTEAALRLQRWFLRKNAVVLKNDDQEIASGKWKEMNPTFCAASF